MKIVYCLNSIVESGGIAKITVSKANAMADIPGNEVFVCVSDHDNNILSSNYLSSKVQLIDLKIGYYKDDWKSKLHVLKGILIKRRRHKKCLRNLFRDIKPDIVISVGLSEKYFLPSIKGNAKVIREFHCVKNYRSRLARGLWNRVVAGMENIYDYKWKVKKNDQIVVLTEEDKTLNWQDNTKVAVIPNPVSFKSENKSALENKKIMTMGRLVYEKNHDSLIRAFAIVAKKHPDWVLEIYGDGPLKKNLQRQIEEKGLSRNVKLMGKITDPKKAYLDSSIFALSSRFEGFGLVLTEAMECGIPVVSYDCPCGPKDIISDGIDGFLVTNGNEEQLAEKISYLIEHPDIRNKMGKAAIEKSKNYTVEKIIQQWMNLFNSLISH